MPQNDDHDQREEENNEKDGKEGNKAEGEEHEDYTPWSVVPHSEIAGTKPPYVCPGCFIHTYSNKMINRFHV
jgi:hypothetical protein